MSQTKGAQGKYIEFVAGDELRLTHVSESSRGNTNAMQITRMPNGPYKRTKNTPPLPLNEHN